MNTLQFLGCVAPNVRYHIPKVRGMIQGVAVRLPQLLEFLDKRGIPHRSEKRIRKGGEKEQACWCQNEAALCKERGCCVVKNAAEEVQKSFDGMQRVHLFSER